MERQLGALKEARKHAKAGDAVNGYYIGLYDAYGTAMSIPDTIIEDIEYKPEGEEPS